MKVGPIPPRPPINPEPPQVHDQNIQKVINFLWDFNPKRTYSEKEYSDFAGKCDDAMLDIDVLRSSPHTASEDKAIKWLDGHKFGNLTLDDVTDSDDAQTFLKGLGEADPGVTQTLINNLTILGNHKY